MAVGDAIGGQGFAGRMGESLAEDAGYSEMEMPWWFNAMENAPTMTQSLGMTAFRGSNTILGGGSVGRRRFNRRPSMNLNEGYTTGRFSLTNRRSQYGAFGQNNPLNPKNWSRYRDQGIFDGPATWGRAEGAGYSPFQVLGQTGNALARTNVGGAALGRAGIALDGEDAFARGTASRISASMKTMNMSDRRFGRALGRGSVQQMLGREFSDDAVRAITAEGRMATGQALGVAGRGAVTSFMGGAMAGARAPIGQGMARSVAMGLGDSAGHRAFASGFNRTSALGTRLATNAGMEIGEAGIKKLGVRGAGRLIMGQGGRMGAAKAAGFVGLRGLGLAVPGLNVAMAAWFAYDMTKMATGLAGAAVKGSVNLAKDAYKSFTGYNNAPMFGRGFKDTAAAATSRARGVEAIQNSRLNARSALGTEAGGMSAHFGYLAHQSGQYA